MPVDGRRRPFDAVDCVRIAENRQTFRARGLAGMIYLIPVKVLLPHVGKVGRWVQLECRYRISAYEKLYANRNTMGTSCTGKLYHESFVGVETPSP